MKELTAVLYSLNDLRRLNLTVNIIKNMSLVTSKSFVFPVFMPN